MRTRSVSDFLLATMPVIVAAFCIEVTTLLSPQVWIAALLELPVFAVLVWYLWELHLRRQLLEELADA